MKETSLVKMPDLGGVKRLFMAYKYPLIIILSVSFLYVIINNFYQLYVCLDGPFHLSVIREVSRNYPPRSPVLHIEGEPDVHYNISVLFQAILYKLTGDIHSTILVSGGLFVALFLVSLCLFASRYTKNQGELSLVLLSALFLWGPVQISWAGVFSFTGLMIGGFYSQTLAYVFFLVVLYLAGVEKQSKSLYVVTAVLMAFCLIQHILTGIILIFLYYLMKVDQYAVSGDFSLRDFLILFIAAPLYLLWPIYPALEVLKVTYQSTSVLLLPTVLVFSSYYLFRKNIGVMATWLSRLDINRHKTLEYCVLILFLFNIFIGAFCIYPHFAMLPGHFRQFNPVLSFILLSSFPLIGLFNRINRGTLFILSWIILLFVMSLAGWATHVGMYWRLLFFLLIPLHILAAVKLSGVEGRLYKTIVMLCVILLLTSQLLFMHIVCVGPKYNDLIYVAGLTPKNAIILSDPMTSHLISGLGDRDVVTSSVCYWGTFVSSDEISERYGVAYAFFLNNTVNKKRIETLGKYNVSYIIMYGGEYDFEGEYHYSSKVEGDLNEISRKIMETGEYTLFKVER